MKITQTNGVTTYIRDSDICMAWINGGKFYISLQTSNLGVPGFDVDELTFWRAVALIDPSAAEDQKKGKS